MMRFSSITRVGLGIIIAAFALMTASAAWAQPPTSTSSSSLGCIPPDLTGELAFTGFEEFGDVPSDLRICRSYCSNLFTLCKHSVGSQNQCVRRLIANLAVVGRTWCRDIDDPDEVRQCNNDVSEDASLLWDENKIWKDDGQMYCRDLRSSCEEDCDD